MGEQANGTELWLTPVPSPSARTDVRGHDYVLPAEYACARTNSPLNYASVWSAWSAGGPIGVAEFRNHKLASVSGGADSITTGRIEFWGIQHGKAGQAKIISPFRIRGKTRGMAML